LGRLFFSYFGFFQFSNNNIIIRLFHYFILFYFSYLDTHPDHNKIEIGHIWIIPSFQRTYANTETNFLLLQYAFESLQCIRVTWKCHAKNVRSRKAAERLGYKYEGTLRNHYLIKKVINGSEVVDKRNSDYLSIIDSEWNDVKKNLLEKLKL
jgi:RimJ/RimL family protein N-acetyltransferase